MPLFFIICYKFFKNNISHKKIFCVLNIELNNKFSIFDLYINHIYIYKSLKILMIFYKEKMITHYKNY